MQQLASAMYNMRAQRRATCNHALHAAPRVRGLHPAHAPSEPPLRASAAWCPGPHPCLARAAVVGQLLGMLGTDSTAIHLANANAAANAIVDSEALLTAPFMAHLFDTQRKWGVYGPRYRSYSEQNIPHNRTSSLQHDLLQRCQLRYAVHKLALGRIQLY